jgi:hypothetical protein
MRHLLLQTRTRHLRGKAQTRPLQAQTLHTSSVSFSQNLDHDTGPFTPTTIACAEEASVPKSVELAVEGDGHMDVVDVESTLRLVTSSGLRLSFLCA